MEKKCPVRIKVVPQRRVSGTVSFEDGHPVTVWKRTPSTVRTVTVYKSRFSCDMGHCKVPAEVDSVSLLI